MSGYLLDTHILLWLEQTPERISLPVRQRLSAPEHRVYVSAVTNWEIATKRQTGKLHFTRPVRDVVREMEFDELPILPAHCDATERLPRIHADPFDRLLLAQAEVERLTLVSADRNFAAYGVAILSPMHGARS